MPYLLAKIDCNCIQVEGAETDTVTVTEKVSAIPDF